MLIGRFGSWALCFLAQVLVLWAIVFWSPCGWPSLWLHSCSHIHTKLCPLAQGHLQCAKEQDIWQRKHTATCIWCLSFCVLFTLFISWEVESKLWLPVLNSSLPWLLLSSFMFRKQKMPSNFELMGLSHSLFTQDSALSQKRLRFNQEESISLVPGWVQGEQMVAVFIFSWTETQMSWRVWSLETPASKSDNYSPCSLAYPLLNTKQNHFYPFVVMQVLLSWYLHAAQS